MRRNLTAVMLVAGLVLALGLIPALGTDLNNTHVPEIVVGSSDDYTVSRYLSMWTNPDPATGKPTDSSTYTNIKITGGTLTVGKTDQRSTVGFELGRVIMTGGNLTINGHAGANQWQNNDAYMTVGWDGNTPGIDVTGGTVTLGENGIIHAAHGGPNSNVFHFGGDAIVNMTGTSGAESVIRAADFHTRPAGNDDYVTFNPNGTISPTPDGIKDMWASVVIDGNAKINVNHGAILSRETKMNGGAITVAAGGKLLVAGVIRAKETGFSPTSVLDGVNGAAQKNGDFNINGGRIDNNGVIDFVAGDMTLNASGGTLKSNLNLANSSEATDGTAYSKNLNVLSGGNFNLDGNLDIAASGTLSNKGNLSITGTATSAKTIDLADGSSTNFGGRLTISSGDLVAGNDSRVTAGGDVTVTSGGVAMGSNSSLTLNNGSSLTASGTLAVEESTRLNITGSGTHTGVIDVADMTVGGSNNAADIAGYLRTQSSSSITGSNEYMWDDVNKKIIYASVAAASASEGIAAVLNRTGNGRMMSALNSGVTDTWAAIITGSLPVTAGTQGEATKALMDTYLNNVTMFTPADEQRSVVSALAGLDAAKSIDVAMLTATNVAGRIRGRVMDYNVARARAADSFGSAEAMASDVMAGIFPNRFWIGGFGLWEDADRRGFDSGYKYKSGGFIAGYDRIFGPITAGGSFAYTSGSYEDKNSLASDSDIDNFALNLYGTYNHASGFFATIIGGYTYSDYDLNNLLTRAGQWNQSKFHANTWTAGGGLGFDIRPTESLSITPTAGLYYYTSATNTFRSTISNGMKVERDSAELPIDLAVNYDIPVGYDGIVRLSAHTGYAYSFGKSGGKLDAFGYNGIDGSNISGIEGRESGRHTWNIGAGVNYSNERLDFGVKYDYYARADHTAHRVLGTIGISF